MNQSLQGKTAVVTGATSGIGRATVLDFAEHGVNVVASGRRENRGAELVTEAQGLAGRVIFVRADITVEEDIETQMTTAVSEFGRIDYAFNNAGGLTGADGARFEGRLQNSLTKPGTISLTRSSKASGDA